MRPVSPRSTQASCSEHLRARRCSADSCLQGRRADAIDSTGGPGPGRRLDNLAQLSCPGGTRSGPCAPFDSADHGRWPNQPSIGDHGMSRRATPWPSSPRWAIASAIAVCDPGTAALVGPPDPAADAAHAAHLTKVLARRPLQHGVRPEWHRGARTSSRTRDYGLFTQAEWAIGPRAEPGQSGSARSYRYDAGTRLHKRLPATPRVRRRR